MRRDARWALVGALSAWAALVPLAHGQQASPTRWVAASPGADAADAFRARGDGPAPGQGSEPARALAAVDRLAPIPLAGIPRRPRWAPLASALVPGAGQALQGLRRAVPYLAIEGFLLTQFMDARRNGRARRREYRDLAITARDAFSERFPTGDFEYYERMQHFVESGAYDVTPGNDLDPETDTATFNGQTWQLARLTYWERPETPPVRTSDEYQRALDFYARRAIAPEFRWSWRNAQFEQDLFSRTIERSNNAFRRSSQYLGVLIANHALSAVDAFVFVRLSQRGGESSRGYEVQATIPWAPLGRPSVPELHDP